MLNGGLILMTDKPHITRLNDHFVLPGFREARGQIPQQF